MNCQRSSHRAVLGWLSVSRNRSSRSAFLAAWNLSTLQNICDHPSLQSQHLGTRSFSTSPYLLKKGAKAAREEKKSTSSDSATSDPFDFSLLEADIAASIERLKTDLSKLRAGGRFNPEVLEKLRVQPDKKDNTTFKLNDLAQVVPKGRTVQILVGEQDVRTKRTYSIPPHPNH